MRLVVVLLCIVIPCIEGGKWGFGPQAKPWPEVFATPLLSETFNSSIKDTTRAWVMIEFYANWCPKCKQLAPEYEFVAYALRDSEVFIAKVDCWKDVGESVAPTPAGVWKVCSHYNIPGYPRVYLAPRDVWLTASAATLEHDHRLPFYPYRAQHLLRALNARMNKNFALPPRVQFSAVMVDHLKGLRTDQGTDESDLPVNRALRAHSPDHVSLWDIEVGTAMLFEFIFKGQARYGEILTPAKRAFFIDFMDVFSRLYPNVSCRASLQNLQQQIDDMWPDYQNGVNVTEVPPPTVRRRFSLCNRNDWDIYERAGWGDCLGSYYFTRGLTCSVWMTFHALVAHAETPEDAYKVLTVLKSWVEFFFSCTECRDHFLKGCANLTPALVSTKKAAVLWLWRKHNIVSRNVGKEEADMDYSGDPAFPKVQWPSQSLCASCHKADGSFDEDEVYKFLLEFYGPVSSPEAAATIPQKKVEL